jgi:hypothetical protein
MWLVVPVAGPLSVPPCGQKLPGLFLAAGPISAPESGTFTPLTAGLLAIGLLGRKARSA